MKTLVDYYNEEEFKNLKLKIEERISHNKYLKLSVFSIICNSDLIILLKEDIEKFEIDIEEKEDYWKIEIERVIERSNIDGGKRSVSGIAFVEKPKYREKIWHIITTGDLDFQSNCVERLIDLLSPQVSRFYLTSHEIKSIFTRFEDEGYIIVVKKAILYSHKEEGEISFKRAPYYRIFNEAEESDMYVDKVEFVIMKEGTTMLHGFITRGGVSKFIGGDIRFFYEKFLPLLADYGEEKRIKLSEKEKQDYDPKPLALKFTEELIRGEDENRRIITSLQNLSRSSIFVYHFNPYLHVSVLDFVDGSSCDIFVSSPDEISVIPSSHSSLSSLMRIFDQLSKDFQEGEIIEKERKIMHFTDFFE